MIGELLINNQDAYTAFGVVMGDDFINNLLAPVDLKELIENESGLENGKRVLYSNLKLAARDVTLSFCIHGADEADYLRKYRTFVEELQKGKICIHVPKLGAEIYKMTYLKSSSFAMNVTRTSSKISIRFNEPNPADRK